MRDNTQKHTFDWETVRQRIAATGATVADLDVAAPEFMQSIWARRAAQLAQIPPQEEEGEQIDLVLVRLGREIYGFHACYVFDIRPAELITRVPRVPPWIAGVTNLRGRILSVVALQRFFGLAKAGNDGPTEESGVLVVVEIPQMELALLVDEVLSVETLAESQVRDATDTVRGLPLEYVRGVAERHGPAGGDGLLVVLDLPALLADERLIVHEEIV